METGSDWSGSGGAGGINDGGGGGGGIVCGAGGGIINGGGGGVGIIEDGNGGDGIDSVSLEKLLDGGVSGGMKVERRDWIGDDKSCGALGGGGATLNE